MKNDTIKFGVFYGLATILLSLVTYYTNPKIMMSPTSWTSILSYVVAIGFMYLAAKKARDKKGGFIPFGEALVPSLLTYAIGMLMGILFIYVLINFIDPSLQPILEEGAQEMLESTYDALGMTEEQKLQQMELIEQQQEGREPFGLLQSLIGWLMSIFIPGLPIAAIIAAIVKKKEPMPIV